ncbi:MAG TPA: DUF4199 domain-containing protein [Mariniphaga anaerophila]|uniref:DUF4199 domain-containing protein n=1 Tax=Mariniphaga anaerophila TaxID=1484053 RepID=A0A831PQI3_9BACT|nr:DUF4199 domain-containing protein [Mariniphaga anaerophila]
MEEKSVSLWKSSVSYGLYLGIALILVSVAYYATGNTFSKSAQWVTYGVMIAGVIIAQLSYRKALGDEMNYGQALGLGVLTMVFASILTGFFTYLLYAVIDPSLQEQMRLQMEEQLVRQGNVPEEQIDMAVEMASKFQKPAIMFIMNIFGGAFIGLVISLITSIFTKKAPKEDFSE